MVESKNLGVRYTGPVTRVTAGSPTDFISQQSGLYDRYLANFDGSWNTLIDVLPVDTSKFSVSMSEGLVKFKAAQLPWYVLGYTDGFQSHPMVATLATICERASAALAKACRTQMTESAVQYIFDTTQWNLEMSRLKSDFSLLVVEEKPKQVVNYSFAVALNRGVEGLPVYSPIVSLRDDDAEMRIHKPASEDLRVSGTKTMRSGELDFKLRALLNWFFSNTFGKAPTMSQLVTASIQIRMMPVADMTRFISKMAIAMDPVWSNISAARLAVLEEGLNLILKAYAEYMPMGQDTDFDVLYKSALQRSIMARPENTLPYVGGQLDVKGSGSHAPAWLIGGDRTELVGDLGICLISPSDSQGIPTGLKNEMGKNLTLTKLLDQLPFRVGEPTRETGSIITFTENPNADVYPFRTQVTGGTIEYTQISLYGPRSDEKTILIPQTSNQPRFGFDADGFIEAISSGNISVLGGNTGMWVGSRTLNKAGIWEA